MTFVEISPNKGEAPFSVIAKMIQVAADDKNTERVFVLDINDAVGCLSVADKDLEKRFKYKAHDICAKTKFDLINALTDECYEEKIIFIKFPFYIKYNVKEVIKTVQEMLSTDGCTHYTKKQFCFMVNRSI